MRILTFTIATVVLIALGLHVYAFYFAPLSWPGPVKRESIRLLSAAKTPIELRAAVTDLGAFVTPTNGGWIAIRYRDTHAGRVQSVSIARDSDGHWFECKRHFCGMLRHAARDFSREVRMRDEIPELFTNQTASVSPSSTPKMEEFIPLFTAASLDAARKQLLAIGFREFTP
jgi:hypothetical protein